MAGRGDGGGKKTEKERKERRQNATAEKGAVGEGTTETVLSVDETNKLRSQLGLAPLKENQHEASDEVPKDEHRQQREHEEEERRTRELREKLRERKEERMLEGELSKWRSLGEQEGEEEDLTSWIERQREAEQRKKKEEERAKAERVARMLEERDKEDEGGEEKELPANGPTPEQLKGMKVQGDVEGLQEGQEAVLTLEDQSIVDERGRLKEDEGLTLEDTRAKEAKRQQKAQEAKKAASKRKEDPYAEKETGRLLPQYEVIEEEGNGDATMEIDEEGRVSKAQEEEQEEIRRKLQENLTGTVREEEAAGAGPKGEQQEFYTKDEMFSKKRAKKGKKKSKNLRQGKLTADELERIAEEEGGPGKSSDLAQRDTAAQRQRETTSKVEDELRRKGAFERAKERAAEEVRAKIGSRGEGNEVGSQSAGRLEREAGEDNEDDDLERALSRSLRAANTRKRDPQKIASEVKSLASRSQESHEEQPQQQAEGSLVLSDTAEFVRGITTEIGSELPTIKHEQGAEKESASTIKEEPSERDADVEQEEKPEILKTEGPIEPDEHLKALKPEMDASKGVAGTLKMLQHTNTAETMESFQLSGRSTEKKGESVRVLREADEIDPGGFEAKKFKFRLDKYDEFGRRLTPKEAFRQMCWRFHGMPPGKAKREKRLRAFKEEQQLKGMESGETPNESRQRVLEVQREQASPYVVLSGKVNPGQTTDARTGYSYAEREENSAFASALEGRDGSAKNAASLHQEQPPSEPGGTAQPFTGQSKVEFNLGKRKALGSSDRSSKAPKFDDAE